MPDARVPHRRGGVLVLGPALRAVSGVSFHVATLLASRLDREFALEHFQVGSEGRVETRLRHWWRLLASPLALAAAIRRHDARLVHINTSLNRAFWRDLAYMAVAKACRARVLLQVHGGAGIDRFFGSRGGHLKRWALRIADVVVVLSQAELEACRRLLPGRTVVQIPNAIDAGGDRDRRRERFAAAPLRVVYLGRLARDKGLRELLEALAAAGRRGIVTELAIAGSGPYEAELRATAAALELQNVRFIGPVFAADKRRLLEDADVFALPSYSEGLPYALLEAMAAGAAVVVTPVGAIPDVVVDGVHGHFVRPRDAASIADALAELAADRETLREMGSASRRRVLAKYTVDRLIEDFRSLYVRLGTAHPCTAPRRRATGA